MPPLDLTKVKGYEDHVRDKMAQKNKEKNKTSQHNKSQHEEGQKKSSSIGAQEKQSAPAKS